MSPSRQRAHEYLFDNFYFIYMDWYLRTEGVEVLDPFAPYLESIHGKADHPSGSIDPSELDRLETQFMVQIVEESIEVLKDLLDAAGADTDEWQHYQQTLQDGYDAKRLLVIKEIQGEADEG